MPRSETNYHTQKNRCLKCGHRWEMHGNGGCEVSTSEYEGSIGVKTEVPQPCYCKKKENIR